MEQIILIISLSFIAWVIGLFIGHAIGYMAGHTRGFEGGKEDVLQEFEDEYIIYHRDS